VDEGDLKARRASSFGAAARSYAEHRPHYPDAAVRWALEPVRSRRVVRVLDLGAGTGRVTEALQRAGVDVIAVEPDAEMRDAMLQRVFGVAVLAGTAEDIPLPDERVDAVLVGQAFHWFDHERALPEIARVLKAGGVLAAMWNIEDLRVPWVLQYAEYADRVGAGPSVQSPVSELGSGFATHPGFEPPQWESFDHTYRRTVDSLLKTVATHSALLVLPEQERSARLQRLREYLESQPETANGEFDLPLVTMVGRAVRR
jgi:SAM-dependent methyltransferase